MELFWCIKKCSKTSTSRFNEPREAIPTGQFKDNVGKWVTYRDATYLKKKVGRRYEIVKSKQFWDLCCFQT